MPAGPWRYVDVNCKRCSASSSIRIDQYNRKKGEWICRSCAYTGRKLNILSPCAKHDPLKNGAWKSYWRAKKRVNENHKNAYGHVLFLFESFDEFWQALGPRPEGCSLDRINVNGNYEKGNVRWATVKEQNRNRRNNIFVVYEGQKMCLNDACKKSGRDPESIKNRIETGCPQEFLFQEGRWNSSGQVFHPKRM
jgi:hypothetical protein